MSILRFSFALFLMLICACVPAQAQVGTPKYQFQSRAQVEAITRKYKLNLRESYNIIMCAKRQGLINSVVRVYEQEAGSNPFNTPPQIASSFALAHEMMGATVRWDWKWDQTPGITSLSDRDGIRMTLYRDRALEALPNSPEVLLSYAIWAKGQGQSEKALNLTTKALKSAPNWADLQWWHARILGSRLSAFNEAQFQKERVRYAILELRALSKAEQLDYYFKKENLISKSHTFFEAKRYGDALSAFDNYNYFRPDYKKYLGQARYQQTRDAYAKAVKTGKDY